MKKSDKKFEWTDKVDQAFAHLKKVLSTPPVLVAPNEKESFLLYIAATQQVVSMILVVERNEEGKAHIV
jgi:dsDNA-binding SOS-regulon protein